jgi:hypothetical protein
MAAYSFMLPSDSFITSSTWICWRKDGYGGVLIAIFNEYITSQVTALDTNCEIVWATIK